MLTFKKPTNVYKKSQVETLETLITENYLAPLKKTYDKNIVLIDVRSKFEYANGHMKNAINIPTATILDRDTIDLFNQFQEDNLSVILYGESPEEVNSAWMLLYQLGFENIKILEAKTALLDNNFEVKAYELEKTIPNYNDIFKTVTVKAPVVKKVPKKVIPVKKKKKKTPEGGC